MLIILWVLVFWYSNYEFLVDINAIQALLSLATCGTKSPWHTILLQTASMDSFLYNRGS